MFRSIIDKEIEIVLKKVVVQFKIIKEKKMHVDLIRFSLTKSMHLKKIVTRVVFLRFIYAIVCSTMKIMIKKVKIKTIFNNNAEINYISKKLINVVQLSIR